MKTTRFAILTMLLSVLLVACGQESAEPATSPAPQADVAPAPAAEPAGKVFIISPKDGAVVENPVLVKFGIEGMTIAPAGTDTPMTGHHHLLIDVETLPAAGQPIPADDHHQHFGKGQTEARVMLSPGEHTLQLLLGDGNHVPHNPPVVSEPIRITVKE